MSNVNKTQNCKVLCSARCDHNSGEGYYNVCEHSKANTISCYGGIDRIYTDGCELLCNKENK